MNPHEKMGLPVLDKRYWGGGSTFDLAIERNREALTPPHNSKENEGLGDRLRENIGIWFKGFSTCNGGRRSTAIKGKNLEFLAVGEKDSGF